MHFYNKRLEENTNFLKCPLCEGWVSFQDYVLHCKKYHGERIMENSCVWCFGKYTWPSNDKKINHSKHLLECFDAFEQSWKSVTPPPSILPTVCQTFGRRLPILEEIERAYDPLWLASFDPAPSIFQDDSLNQALSYVQTYIHSPDLEWFHITVTMDAFEEFLKALDKCRGLVRTLPFSCWCDGGPYWVTAHRHFIIVTSLGHSLRTINCWWDKLRDVLDEPLSSDPYYPYVQRSRIKSAVELVDIMGRLSRPESMCDLCYFIDYQQQHYHYLRSCEQSLLKSDTAKLGHFYICARLPADPEYKLALVTQWDGGLLQLLDWEYGKRHPNEFLAAPSLQCKNGDDDDDGWQLEIRDLPDIDMDIVLPVSKRFVPCKEQTTATPICVHLIGERKLYFEEDAGLEEMKDEDWQKLQIERGNCLYNTVDREWWILSEYQQMLLNYSRKRKVKLENGNTKLVKKN